MVIFYADDDVDDRDFLIEGFRELNPSIRCLTARDGQELIEMLRTLLILPDYIFLDINMPIMNGRRCLKNLKSNKVYCHIPVVIYSTSTDEEEIQELYNLGAYKYIRKPDSVKTLLSSLRSFLEQVSEERAENR